MLEDTSNQAGEMDIADERRGNELGRVVMTFRKIFLKVEGRVATKLLSEVAE